MERKIHCYFLRHANAAPPKEGEPDISIDLSQKGVSQAEKVAKEFKDIKFDHIFCSPAQRSLQTLNNVIEGAWDPATWTICWPLYGDKIQDLKDMFATYEYSPLSKYFSDQRAEVLKNYGKNVAKIIEGTLGVALAKDNMKDKKEVNILIVGHAVLLNVLALYLPDSDSLLYSKKAKKAECMERVLGEADCMVFDIVQK